MLAGGCDGEYVFLRAVSGACCLAGGSDSGPLRKALREPKRICLMCFGNIIIWWDASGKTCGGTRSRESAAAWCDTCASV